MRDRSWKLSAYPGIGTPLTGPYASAILRFQISFPDTYPSLPPLVTFSTDIFHPLITPLTTYMYTTDIQDNGTVSATDEERLPPGGFSLRHGFPDWFGRGSRSRVASGAQQATTTTAAAAASSSNTTTTGTSTSTPAHLRTPPRSSSGKGAGGGGSSSLNSSNQSTPGSGASPRGPPSFMQTKRREVSTYDVLRYVRSTFDDSDVLDSVPLEAAGNPGAWQAWRTHQQQQKYQQGRRSAAKITADGVWHPGLPSDEVEGKKETGAAVASGEKEGGANAAATTRRPGEWNWEHVWEERVKKGISASLSDPVLFGSASAADDVVSFLLLYALILI